MSNSITALNKEVWSSRVQTLLKNNLVGMKIANAEERANLSSGDVVHRPYTSELYAQDYTKGTDVTMLDVTATDESLSVDTTKVIPVYIDDVDKIQNSYATIDVYTERAAYELRDIIDRAVLAEVANATLSNTAVAMSTSNIVSQISNSKAALANNGVEMDKPLYGVVDPDTLSLIEQYQAANGFMVQDKTLVAGYANNFMGKFLGVDIYSSQNLPSSVVLSLATQVTEGDTVTINGVVFTFNATPSGAGSVDIGGDADASRLNLSYAINGTGTVGTDYIDISAADRAKLKRRGVVAVDSAGANTLTVTAAGKMTVSKTLTDTTDGWGTQTLNMMFGQYKNTDLVIQKDVGAEFKDAPLKLGKNILTWTLYGKKTFREGAQRMFKLSALYT